MSARPSSSDVAEQCCRNVLIELISTEEQYVQDLISGIERYSRLFQHRSALPSGLVGQQHVLLSNITDIAALHRHRLLPLLLQHRQQLEVLFERWYSLVERDVFYCYVLFTASQRESLRLYHSHELYFRVSSNRTKVRLSITYLSSNWLISELSNERISCDAQRHLSVAEIAI